jgi:hypothetical protein
VTINIGIAVSEGLVMAADSLTRMEDRNGEFISIHNTGEKITEIRGRSIALMIHGLGEIGKRTIISLVREFEFKEYEKTGCPIRNWTVEELCSNLHAFINARYRKEFPNPDSNLSDPDGSLSDDTKPGLGIVVGGYSPNEFFPELIELQFPTRKRHPDGLVRVLPRQSDRPTGEAHIGFWGHTKAIEQLIHGYHAESIDEAIAVCTTVDRLRQEPKSKQEFDGLPVNIKRLARPPEKLPGDIASIALLLGMETRLEGMPLQEAVEFAEYLGNVAIGYDRFSRGTPTVGGELDVVAIQPNGLHWHKRKPFLVDMAEARMHAIKAEDQHETRSLLEALRDEVQDSRRHAVSNSSSEHDAQGRRTPPQRT